MALATQSHVARGSICRKGKTGGGTFALASWLQRVELRAYSAHALFMLYSHDGVLLRGGDETPPSVKVACAASPMFAYPRNPRKAAEILGPAFRTSVVPSQ